MYDHTMMHCISFLFHSLHVHVLGLTLLDFLCQLLAYVLHHYCRITCIHVFIFFPDSI